MSGRSEQGGWRNLGRARSEKGARRLKEARKGEEKRRRVN